MNTPTIRTETILAPLLSWEEAVARGGQLPANFGDGWLSDNAADLVRIALIAGFDRAELLRRLCFDCDPSRVTNMATIERILGEMAPGDEAV